MKDILRTVASIIVLAFLGLPGSGSAAGTDGIAPVKVAADAPGMIRFDSCTRPTYPEPAHSRKQEGTVTLRFLVGSDGKVRDARLVKSSGYPALDEAAAVGLSKCSFNPAVKDGKPVDAWTAVQYVWKAE